MKKPRWLLVVRPDQEELYELLRRRLADDERVEVVLDQRERERRRGSSGAQRERRRGSRRQRPPASASIYDARSWPVAEAGREAGHASAGARDEDRPVSGTQTCSRCGIPFEFELPRFVQPPARVVFTVVHTEDPVLGVQHAIDTEAFTQSGRALLATRSQARRRVAPPGAV